MNKPIETLPARGERIMAVTAARMDATARTVELSFSSDAPVEMRSYDGTFREILSHDLKAVRMDRLNSRAPLLYNHDRDNLIGVVESARIQGNKGMAIVRFSETPAAADKFRQVQEGILSNVSVGYIRHRVEAADRQGNMEVVRVTDWEPLEVSLVTVPADISVGVGRQQDEDAGSVVVQRMEKTNTKKFKIMDEKQPAADQKRLDEIDGITSVLKSRNIDFEQEAARAKLSGETVDDFRKRALEALPQTSAAKPVSFDEKKELKGYSLLRAIDCARTGTFDGLEGEAHKELARITRRSGEGIQIPNEIFGLGARTMLAGSATYGGNLIAEDMGPTIGRLEAQPIVEMAGARRLGGLVGDLVLPRMTGGTTCYWLAEGATVDTSDMTVGTLRLAPRRLAALSQYSSQMSIQSSGEVEALLRGDMSRALLLELDRAALQGVGGAEPTGLFSLGAGDGLNTITWGAAAGMAKVLEAIAAILSDNADTGTLAGLITPNAWAKMANVKIDAGSGNFLYSGDLREGRIAPGIRSFITSQIPDEKSVFGNFGEMMLGLWQGVTAVIDPYTNKASGLTDVYLELHADIGIRHPESFCVSTDSAAQ